MPATFTLTRKTVLSLVAAGLLTGTAMVSTLALAPPVQVQAQSVEAIDPTRGFSELVDRVMPAVVNVEVRLRPAAADDSAAPDLDNMPEQFRDFFNQFPQFRDRFGNRPGQPGRPNRGGMAQGSGFVISPDGYVVTNNHVVDNASEVTLSYSDGTEFIAKVIGTDSKTDLALLKIDTDKTLPYVKLAATEAKVGDWVMAVGNPFGLGGTVTSGIISAKGRDIGNGPYDDFIQIDASINRGNSGGPAFNLEGEVIGVNTAIYSPSGGSVGIGFAIPANVVKDVVESLKANGAVTRGWLGVKIQPVSAEIAEGLGLDKAEGAIISEVTEKSPALAAGLQQGDTILKMGEDVISDARDLARTVARVKPGAEIPFSIIRDGKPVTVNVKLGTMPLDQQQAAAPAPAKAEPADLASLGLKVAPAEDGAGVKVIEVAPNSQAAERGVKAGDVILELAGREVNSADDIQTALAADTNKRVLLLLKSGNDQRFVALPRDKG
jgi:serine protease Do